MLKGKRLQNELQVSGVLPDTSCLLPEMRINCVCRLPGNSAAVAGGTAVNENSFASQNWQVRCGIFSL